MHLISSSKQKLEISIEKVDEKLEKIRFIFKILENKIKTLRSSVKFANKILLSTEARTK